MKRLSFQPVQALLAHPAGIASVVAGIFSVRFLDCLPFSQSTRLFNYETVATLVSFLMYAKEPLSFPLGAIESLTFPFHDANVGNVGALPLVAILVKALGTLIPYFQTFDYFVLVEIVAVWFTTLFSQYILLMLGVWSIALRGLGGFLVGTSFMLLIRSSMLQPFCVVSFPLFTAWIYVALVTLRRSDRFSRADIFLLALFPVAALLDYYALIGILLGTAALWPREFFEAFFGGQQNSWNRFNRVSLLVFGGVALSVVGLYLVGMFPTPPGPTTFTSYDFGIGGRYHVADLFAPWIPVGEKIFSSNSLLGRIGFPLTTDHLAPGQYEGIAYVGTPVLILWGGIVVGWLIARFRPRPVWGRVTARVGAGRIALYSPWVKVGLAALAVFIFSLGYELHVYGVAYPHFAAMPAAWIADRLPPIYNIRATGRLAPLLSLYLILEGVRQLHRWCESSARKSRRSGSFSVTGLVVVVLLAVVQLVEISPLLRPVSAQPLYPIGGTLKQDEIETLRRLGASHDLALIAPSVRAAEVGWTTEAFSTAYYLGLRSNLYYIARPLPSHDAAIAWDLARVLNGDWDSLTRDYGNVLIVVPASVADHLRAQMRPRFNEVRVGMTSLWSKRN